MSNLHFLHTCKILSIEHNICICYICIIILAIFAVPGVDVPDQSLPEGLVLLQDFISPEYEQLLLQSIEWDIIDKNMSEG